MVYLPEEVVLLTQPHGTVHYIWQDIQIHLLEYPIRPSQKSRAALWYSEPK